MSYKNLHALLKYQRMSKGLLIYLFIYLKLLVYTCKTICSSQKHRNIGYTGVTRQGGYFFMFTLYEST